MEMARVFINPKIREQFEIEKQEGCHCPLCGKYAKVYRRKLNSGMASRLIKLYNATDIFANTDYLHISDFLGKGMHPTDFSKLKFWGLIESMPNDDPSKRSSGYWRITYDGMLFVQGNKRVKSHSVAYNDEFICLDGNEVDIRDCLGKHFDYAELMGE